MNSRCCRMLAQKLCNTGITESDNEVDRQMHCLLQNGKQYKIYLDIGAVDVSEGAEGC